MSDDETMRRSPRHDRDALRSRLAARPTVEITAPRIDPRARRTERQVPFLPVAAEDHPSPTEGAARVDPRARRRDRQEAIVPSTTAAAPDVMIIEAPAFHVLVVPDLERGQLSAADHITLGAARMLADTGGGAVFLALMLPPDGQQADDAGVAGADRVVVLRHTAFSAHDPDTRAGAAIAVAKAVSARHVMLGETRSKGADLARRVAARLGGGLAVGVVRVNAVSVTSVIDAGRREAVGPAPRVITVDPAIFPIVPATRTREARLLAPPPFAAGSKIHDDGLLPIEPRSLPLAEAEMVLSAGDGVTDWNAFHALATALQAAEAGSRVVCDAGHLPRSRQVGASGTIVSAQCYIATGISGSTQHLHGIADCRTVIAVNTDLHAAMVARAELAIIADAQEVMPALAKLVEERKHAL